MVKHVKEVGAFFPVYSWVGGVFPIREVSPLWSHPLLQRNVSNFMAEFSG